MKHIWRRFRPKPAHIASPVVTTEAESLLDQLLDRTPGAVRAQREMDSYQGSYHTDKSRLYELIDFNDAYVSLALSLSSYERRGFVERVKAEMSEYCLRAKSPMFTDQQFEAITKGLGREVATYLGAKSAGYSVTMTSRTQDAMGVDMIITEPDTGKSLNIDCKSPSAYHYRIRDLRHQGRMTDVEAEQAELTGYAFETNGHGADAVNVTLLRIDPNETGDITDLEFEKPELIDHHLADLFKLV